MASITDLTLNSADDVMVQEHCGQFDKRYLIINLLRLMSVLLYILDIHRHLYIYATWQTALSRFI